MSNEPRLFVRSNCQSFNRVTNKLTTIFSKNSWHFDNKDVVRHPSFRLRHADQGGGEEAQEEDVAVGGSQEEGGPTQEEEDHHHRRRQAQEEAQTLLHRHQAGRQEEAQEVHHAPQEARRQEVGGRTEAQKEEGEGGGIVRNKPRNRLVDFKPLSF